MRIFTITAATLAIVATSGVAHGALYEATLRGVLVTEGGGPAIDSNLHVGSSVVMTARFNQSWTSDFDPVSLSGAADLWSLPTNGPLYYRLQMGPLLYDSRFDYLDGELGPLITFENGHITRFVTASVGTEEQGLPLVYSGLWYQQPDLFDVLNPHGLYGSEYPTQGFLGAWDLSGSSVRRVPSPIPEPATWALTILGFLGLGAMLRVRRADDGCRPFSKACARGGRDLVSARSAIR